ncbi:diguanylate cyclase [Pseudorhodoferax sp. Leaf274]|uniref:GGDEF domain-containing protein n=1 Tax=Pseudorhodoferax sp. Leaf274 TaxID=1736318 RepID=UPI000702CB2C|nr:GGDEF domain-containing protein [Pseudorhodoferax sp. Leaf274]KQP35496.1 hypothetical protein ASF44_19365 [Pseudorhodoferax sp. Leaf274]
MKNALLQAIGVALDGLEVAYCAFDEHDRTLAWNKTFLSIFPEHIGKIHVGEAYAENLRRFYDGRLRGEERASIDRYIAEGIARHRSQRRPYEFDHQDARVRVSSFEIGRFGRLRVWRKVAALATIPSEHVSSTRRLAEIDAMAVLERLAAGVVIVDVADRVMWSNQAFLDLYDLDTAEAALGRRFESIYRAAWTGREGDAAFVASMATLRDNQRFSGAPFVLALPGERFVRVIEQRGTADGRGCFEHADITDLQRQQVALEEAERRYRLLAEFSSDIILSVEHGVTTYASPALSELLGWEVREVLGRALAEFCHADDVPVIAKALRSVRRGQTQQDYRVRALHKDGSFVWVEARARHLPGDCSGLEDRRVVNLRGIAARKAVEDALAQAQCRLQALATTDPLTGLANRRKLDEVLQLEFRRVQRGAAPLSLLLVDIDHFKQFNDTHGHHVGDEVLQRVAAEMTRLAQRAGDLAARLGGEEFVLLLPGAGAEEAALLAQALRRQVGALDLGTAAAGRITVSVGVATVDAALQLSEPGELLRRADAALYRAKREGRNRVVTAGP